MSDPKHRVLLVNPFDAYAGSQRIGRAIVVSLAQSGIETSVKLGFGGQGFLSDLPGVAPDIRCNHILTRKLLYPFWSVFALFTTAMSAMRGQMVWANSVYAVPPALLAILLFPKRTVIHLHEVTFPRPFRLLLRLASWRGSAIVCVSADQAQRVGLAAEIVPNPVDSPADDMASGRDRLLFIGTTQPMKGFALFVAVCAHLNDLGLRTTAFLSDEDRHDRALVEAARAAGIGIVFGERSTDVMYADGFLLLLCTDPRLWVETFSLVAAEAVSYLVPVAGTGSTVLPEVIGDALAFNDPVRDPAQIARAITDLYHDPDRYAALCAACKIRRPNFAQSVFAERIENLLQRRKSG